MMNPGTVLWNILADLNLVTDEEAGRASTLIAFTEDAAQVGVEIDGRHYIISVEDVSS